MTAKQIKDELFPYTFPYETKDGHEFAIDLEIAARECERLILEDRESRKLDVKKMAVELCSLCLYNKVCKNVQKEMPCKEFAIPQSQAICAAFDAPKRFDVSKLPPIDKAHTYGSENADVYRAYDKGQEDYRRRVIDVLDAPQKKTCQCKNGQLMKYTVMKNIGGIKFCPFCGGLIEVKEV
jgi:hypothetical protein